MKALSLTQPWASLVAAGLKQWETRSWSTNYRGALAIHASKGFPKWARDFAFDEHEAEGIPAPLSLPRGAVLCIVKLKSVQRTELISPKLSTLEKHYGDYEPGRFAWELELVELFDAPIPAIGSLGLWEWQRPR